MINLRNKIDNESFREGFTSGDIGRKRNQHGTNLLLSGPYLKISSSSRIEGNLSTSDARIDSLYNLMEAVVICGFVIIYTDIPAIPIGCQVLFKISRISWEELLGKMNAEFHNRNHQSGSPLGRICSLDRSGRITNIYLHPPVRGYWKKRKSGR